MAMSDREFRDHFVSVIVSRLDTGADSRQEALREYFGLRLPGVSEQEKDCLAVSVPALIPALYRRWAGMCAARMVETVPADQREHLCDGSAANNAALILVFLMFLESERMEKQMVEDLAAYGQAQSGAQDLGALAADFIRAHMARLKSELDSRNREKIKPQ